MIDWIHFFWALSIIYLGIGAFISLCWVFCIMIGKCEDYLDFGFVFCMLTIWPIWLMGVILEGATEICRRLSSIDLSFRRK